MRRWDHGSREWTGEWEEVGGGAISGAEEGDCPSWLSRAFFFRRNAATTSAAVATREPADALALLSPSSRRTLAATSSGLRRLDAMVASGKWTPRHSRLLLLHHINFATDECGVALTNSHVLDLSSPLLFLVTLGFPGSFAAVFSFAHRPFSKYERTTMASEAKSGDESKVQAVTPAVAAAVKSACGGCPAKPDGKVFKYGTAGFRDVADVLDSTFLRVGMLSALRGKHQNGQVRARGSV